MRSNWIRWIALANLAVLVVLAAGTAGCATKKVITVSARPADTRIIIDGTDRGRGPITETFLWNGDKDVHKVGGLRPGYKDQTISLSRDYDKDNVVIEMKPLTRRVMINVTPVPAVVSIDGKPVTPDPVAQISTELEFTMDGQNRWTTHTVTASHAGYQDAEQTIAWTDKDSSYTLQLDAMRKNLAITTTPPGATIYFDGEVIGKSPVVDKDRAFAVDAAGGQYLSHKLRAVKPGFDPVEKVISWEDGKTDYHIDLIPKMKTVHITSTPPGATVTIDGAEVAPDDPPLANTPTAKLAFPPIDDKGTLKTYTATITKKTENSEWEPQKISIGWDDGKGDYSVTLKEILTRPVPLVVVDQQRSDGGWELLPKKITTIAMKDVTEGPNRGSPELISSLPKGTIIDTLSVSPSGDQILFSILAGGGGAGGAGGKDKSDFRSQMMLIKTNAKEGAELLTDGKTLDLHPTFTPDGKTIVFSSNRGGRRQNVWQMSADGKGAITQLTVGDTNDLWPNIDADPNPRLFYMALVDTRPDARVYMSVIGTTKRVDLTYNGGSQPRISPKGDAVVFTSINSKSGKRNIYKMSDKGGAPELLTNATEADEFDPVWSADGSKIAFVSDRAIGTEKQGNFDIWVIDLSKPERPMQITTNGSWDDCPSWDPSGSSIYFRSNRGGDWGIWKIGVK
ncbi:MAG TPA: PEGA domain-containing protein [Tepidisphaeraceae bacterium]